MCNLMLLLIGNVILIMVVEYKNFEYNERMKSSCNVFNSVNCHLRNHEMFIFSGCNSMHTCLGIGLGCQNIIILLFIGLFSLGLFWFLWLWNAVLMNASGKLHDQAELLETTEQIPKKFLLLFQQQIIKPAPQKNTNKEGFCFLHCWRLNSGNIVTILRQQSHKSFILVVPKLWVTIYGWVEN